MTGTTTSGGLGNPKLELIDSVDDAQRFISWLGERRPLDAVAMDLETGERPGGHKNDALSPWKGEIRLMQIGDGETGWAMDWKRWSGVFYQGMTNYQGPVICHNIAFEAKWMAVNSDYKFPWHNAHDTMIMSQVIQPASKTHGLKPLTDRLVDPFASHMQDQLDQIKTKNGWTWGTIPIDFPIYWQYGALDTVITTRLFLDHFYDQVKSGRQLHHAYELEMATRRICTQMEVRGARVDVEYSGEMAEKMERYAESVKAKAYEAYGVNVNSNVPFGKLLAELGAPMTKLTGGGAFSVDKEALGEVLANPGTPPEARSLIQAVSDMKKAEKLASAYFRNFEADAIDGILHPDIKTLEARTGRMSIVNPALQTIPSGSASVRRAFLPRNEGEGIVSSDLDQVEFRLTANFSQDPGLIELFLEADRTGGDVFTSIMREVYKDDSLTKDDPRRKLIKGNIYGRLYGAGTEKQAQTAGVPVADMQELSDAFDRRYPGVKRFSKKVEREGYERFDATGEAYVETYTGRKLPADQGKVYALTNYKIQGTAAEVFKTNLTKLDAAGLTEFMVVPVHDEIVLSMPTAMYPEASQVIQECMTSTEGWDVPLTAGVEGPFTNWGSKYEKS